MGAVSSLHAAWSGALNLMTLRALNLNPRNTTLFADVVRLRINRSAAGRTGISCGQMEALQPVNRGRNRSSSLGSLRFKLNGNRLGISLKGAYFCDSGANRPSPHQSLNSTNPFALSV